ncbi:hypothetical protein [uncultured Bacteroides sp.]|uniref:hypothetical protein n=1 Tax=uncultured Bacteroides sp. TaxID=162156 RepID=UPI002AAADCC1|nr:hypothetical protein [uncultured Bacteroides sp.]
MKRILLSLLFILTINNSIHCSDKYIIFKYKVHYSVEPKKSYKTYYWIASIDSIKSAKFCIYPLYLDGIYSKSNLDTCINGGIIDVFSHNKNENFDFEEEYLKKVDSLVKLINDKSIKVQTITNRWENKKGKWKKKRETKIEVYAVPVYGNFCNCLNENKRNNVVFFLIKIYLLVDSFQLYNEFWKSPQSDFVKYNYYDNAHFDKYVSFTQNIVFSR